MAKKFDVKALLRKAKSAVKRDIPKPRRKQQKTGKLQKRSKVEPFTVYAPGDAAREYPPARLSKVGWRSSAKGYGYRRNLGLDYPTNVPGSKYYIPPPRLYTTPSGEHYVYEYSRNNTMGTVDPNPAITVPNPKVQHRFGISRAKWEQLNTAKGYYWMKKPTPPTPAYTGPGTERPNPVARRSIVPPPPFGPAQATHLSNLLSRPGRREPEEIPVQKIPISRTRVVTKRRKGKASP